MSPGVNGRRCVPLMKKEDLTSGPLMILQNIVKAHTSHSKVWKILVAIRDRVEEYVHWQVSRSSLSQVKREKNMVADSMEKEALHKRSNFLWWPDQVVGKKKALTGLEKEGVPYLRG
ncbi:hypothetical protein LIER_25307 [Lithospermum erythrorhizon]|uniref:RNase H type-1 domain-containing protein n=1 Tax=Lithospermum erythrorhizon TaxID=34254 RepID=A0AAV3RA49_LITER